MTNGKLTIEATGISVVVEITAHPGDTLLIINGVCVGVQSAGGKTKATVAALRSVAPAKKGSRVSVGVRTEKVVEVLREHGPKNTAHLLDLLGLDNKDPERARYRQQLRRMATDGAIVPIKGDKNKPRPVWEIGK